MASIIHFDIAANDVKRAKHFYEELFGWKIEKFPFSEDEYYLIETHTANGEKGIGGGMAKREKQWQGITNFIQVDSIDKSLDKLKKLGGTIIEPKAPIPNVGYIAVCKDTEGNILGIMEVQPKAK